jgi:hypothetical protein
VKKHPNLGTGWDVYLKALLNFGVHHFQPNQNIMTLKSERDMSYGREKIFRDQIVTIGDLKDFKEDLLQQLSRIVAENMTPAKKWLKSAEVRKLLNISPGTLQSMRNRGELSYTKVGGIIFYEAEDIQKMISKNKVSAITRFGR